MKWRVALTFLLVASSAAAQQEEAACQASYVAGQKRYKLDHDLLGGREQLLVCAKSCPDQLRASCGKWLREIDAELPSIVVKAIDGRGRDVTNLGVDVDDTPVKYVEGLALELNPGRHVVRVRDRSGKKIEQSVLLSAGEKLKVVEVRLEPPIHDVLASRPVPMATYILLGVGGAALASAATFAIWSSVEFSHTTSCAPACSPSSRDASFGVKTAVADVSFSVAGAALLAAGIVYLARATVTERPRTGTVVAPAFGASYVSLSVAHGL